MAETGTWIWDIHDPAHPTVVARLSQDNNQGWSLSFSPDGHTLAGSGGDQLLHLWDYQLAAVAKPRSTDSVEV